MRILPLVMIFLSGCGTATDPDQDRRTIEAFAADPAKGDETAARAAAERLSRTAETTGQPRDRLVLAAFFDAAGEPERALEQLGQIPDDLPDPKTAAAARLSEGRIALYRTRQARRAEAALNAAARLDPALHQVWAPLASLYDIQNRRAERDASYARLDDVSALDRNQLLSWTCDRRLDAEVGEHAQVLRAFVAADPADVRSAIALAEDRIRRGDFAAAVAELDRIESAGDPAMRQAVALRRGLIATDQGEFAEAGAMLERIDAAMLDAADAGIYDRLTGKIHLQARNYADAETSLRRAVDRRSIDRESHQLLVQVLRLAGRADEAGKVAERLATIDRLEDLGQKVRASLRRDDPATLRAIADTAAALGRYALAKAWLRQLLAKDPLNAALQQEIYRIDQLSKTGS